MISDEAAASIDAMIERLRADVKRLTRERDDAQCEVKRLERENLGQLDTIFELEQRLSMKREG
jgi:hypothetical protein